MSKKIVLILLIFLDDIHYLCGPVHLVEVYHWGIMDHGQLSKLKPFQYIYTLTFS